MTLFADGRPAASGHTCHAKGCDVRVPRRLFMCRWHWYRLPVTLRDAVWATYVPGQESRMDPSREYLDASRRAIEWLANLEGV
jgi:hypothetical protein